MIVTNGLTYVLEEVGCSFGEIAEDVTIAV